MEAQEAIAALATRTRAIELLTEKQLGPLAFRVPDALHVPLAGLTRLSGP
jgi:hypothetical protein